MFTSGYQYFCTGPISTVLASPLAPEPSTDAGTIVLIVVLVLITVFAFTVIFVLLAVTFYLATELKNVRRDKLSRPNSDTGKGLSGTVAILEEKCELEKRLILLENEKKALEQGNTQLKTQYEANEDTLKTTNQNLFELQHQKSELEKQVAVLQFEKERQISQGSRFSDEPDSRMAPECTNVATLLTKITRDIAGECPQFLTPIFCLKTVRNIVECLTENVNCNTDQFKNLMRKIRRDAEDLCDIFVDKKKQKQEQSKNLGERSTEVDCDDEGGMLAEEYQWCLDKLDEKLRELGVEIEDQVQEMADQVQETADQVQETKDQVQETEDQVQKVVDLDQEGDDLR